MSEETPPEPPIGEPPRGGPRPLGKNVKLAAMIREGMLHPPVQLETQYKGKRFQAKVEQDGSVVFDGKRYKSLSAAASAAMATVIGGKPAADGWLFWRMKDGNPVGDLRPDHVIKTKSRTKTKVEWPRSR